MSAGIAAEGGRLEQAPVEVQPFDPEGKRVVKRYLGHAAIGGQPATLPRERVLHGGVKLLGETVPVLLLVQVLKELGTEPVRSIAAVRVQTPQAASKVRRAAS